MPKNTSRPDASTSRPQEDNFTKLPSEILHMIFDYLFCCHQHDRAFHEADGRRIKDPISSTCNHDLDHLSATSKILRSEMNDWAIHFMTTYSDITKFHMPKTTKKDKSFNMLRGRKSVLTWARTHCIFCGKVSSRRAILMNGFKCCAKCDKVQWPDKITKTCARDEFYLKDTQLLPHLKKGSAKDRLLPETSLPRIHYGTYNSTGVIATMFLRRDVERLAAAVHGDLDGYLAKRRLEREERQKKIQANREARRAADEEALAQMAGASATNPVDLGDDDDGDENDDEVIEL